MRRTPFLVTLISSLLPLPGVYADALLFPYVVTSDSVTTIISVVNQDSTNSLNLEYFVKNNASHTALCTSSGFSFIDSAQNDIVSFEANGRFSGSVLSATGGPLFNDPANVVAYTGDNFTMGPVSIPRRAFLIVDDNDSDGEDLYGEAMILETAGGAAWGYRAFNPADDNNTSPVFDSTSPALAGVINDVLGEALDGGNNTDEAPVTLLPTNEWSTRFFVTPLEDTNQRNCTDCSIQVSLTRDSGGNNPGVFDRDTNPFVGSNDVDVVCVSGVDMTEMLPASVLATVSSQGGWGFVDIDPGDVGPNQENAAVAIKLEFNKVQFISPNVSNSFVGTVNTAVWIRNRDDSEGVSGF